MMRLPTSKHRRALWLLAVATVLALVAAGCGDASTSDEGANEPTSGGPITMYTGDDFSQNQPVDAPGVTNTEIHVGSIVSKTNPLGTDLDRFNDGLKAYFDQVNAKGGVWGRTIKLTSERDDKTGGNATETEALLAQDNVFAVFEAVQLFTGAPKLAQAGIPTFGWNINPEWAGPKNFFPNVAPVCFSGCIPQPHMNPFIAQKVGAHKVAALAYNVPQAASCAEGAQKSFQRFGEEVGAEMVYLDTSLTFGQADYSAQVAQMKAKGVDMLVSCLDYNGTASVAEEMQKQGILEQVTISSSNLYNHDFVRENAEVLEGVVVMVPILAFEHRPQIPAVKQFVDYAKAHDVVVREMTAQGWVAGLQFVNALKAAGPNFTWPNLVGAWNQQTWYTGGGWVPAINWTRQHDVANKAQFECANFVRIEDGGYVGIWDENGQKPWVCFNGQKPSVWQTPVNVSFAGEPFKITDVQQQR